MNKNSVRIVMDTNIFISAMLGSTYANKLLLGVYISQFDIIMTEEILDELKIVLARPKFSKYIKEEQIERLVTFLSAKIIKPRKNIKINDCRDPKDNMILEAALQGNVDYIITGDKDLLVLNPYETIKILDLNEFLNIYFI